MSKDHPLFPWCLGAATALLSSTLVFWGLAWGAVDGLSQVQLQKTYEKLPLHFIPNQGQTEARVQYYTQRGGSAFFFTREGVVLSLAGKCDQPTGGRPSGKEIGNWQPPRSRPGKPMVVQLNPVGMSPRMEMMATDLQGGRFNYFFGSDPGKWQANIPTYRAVTYRGAYPGIDVKFYGNGRQLEYDLIIQPGADPSRVKFQYQGIKGLGITRAGDLAIRLPGGENLIQKKPTVYQEIAGQRVPREGKFKILADRGQFTYGFELAAYDPKHPLVIDPTLEYLSYLGGSSFDVGNGIAVDSSGCAYVTGYTYSGNFPLTTDLITDRHSITSAVFVAKIDPKLGPGEQLVYSTLVGGSSDNYANAIAVDIDNCVYVAGGTRGSNFPTVGSTQTFGGGSWDAFVFKLGPSGDNLIYSTFLGGSDLDIARGIAIQGANVYVTGKTFSSNFPLCNAAQAKPGGGGDVFVTSLKFEYGLLSLMYSTYLGGSGDDAGNGIVVDGDGNACVVGETNSRNFPTTSKAGATGDYDAFVARFGSNGARQYTVRLGGSNYDSGQAIAMDGSGIYVTGYSYSGTGFPTTNALNFTGVAGAQTAETGAKKASAASKGGGSKTNIDAFVTKIKSDGSALLYSVRLGGSGTDYGFGIAVDSSRCAYVTGGTSSPDFPTTSNRLAGKGGGRDVFVTKLNALGNSAVFSTYLPGNNDEEGFAIAVDVSGNAYLTGYTYSTDFYTLNAFQTTLNRDSGNVSVYDAFVTKIGSDP
jgi:hypothetical protein